MLSIYRVHIWEVKDIVYYFEWFQAILNKVKPFWNFLEFYMNENQSNQFLRRVILGPLVLFLVVYMS